MANIISLIVRSADKTQKAGVNLPADLTVQQLLDAAKQRWNLPSQTNYAVRIERTGQQLHPEATLWTVGVRQNDVVEFYPILEAGKI